MSVHDADAPVQLEVISENLVVTPTLAKLLVRLARRQLHHEALQAAEGSTRGENAA